MLGAFFFVGHSYSWAGKQCWEGRFVTCPIATETYNEIHTDYWAGNKPALPALLASKVGQKQADAGQKQEKEQKQADAEQLAKAIDYFTSQKYHECLLILQSLNKRYRLNPRYKAYLGVCYYYEWEYEQAIQLLDEAIPQLAGFAPQERSLYCWMDGESHFQLQRYGEAIPLYEQMLPICHDDERPDAYYRLGFCHLYKAKELEQGQREEMLQEMKRARECFEQSLAGYLEYRNTPDMKARIAQLRNMINGLK